MVQISPARVRRRRLAEVLVHGNRPGNVDDDDERDVARGLVVRVDDLVETDDEEEEDAGDRSPSRDPRDYDV